MEGTVSHVPLSPLCSTPWLVSQSWTALHHALSSHSAETFPPSRSLPLLSSFLLHCCKQAYKESSSVPKNFTTTPSRCYITAHLGPSQFLLWTRVSASRENCLQTEQATKASTCLFVGPRHHHPWPEKPWVTKPSGTFNLLRVEGTVSKYLKGTKYRIITILSIDIYFLRVSVEENGARNPSEQLIWASFFKWS